MVNPVFNDIFDGNLNDNNTTNGTILDDVIVLDNGNDTSNGGAGNDLMFGNGGRDSLQGGDGNDEIQGGAGNDTLDGGSGNDTLDGGTGNDRLFGQGGADTLIGGSGNDFLDSDTLGAVDNIGDRLDGGAGNDTLQGEAGNDTLLGGSGNDRLTGDDSSINFGNDNLSGGSGNDTLTGRKGNDTLVGGSGNDSLTGTDSIGDGIGERDLLTSGSFADRDIFILGDSTTAYYLDAGIFAGNNSFARISDFDIIDFPGEPVTQVDKIQLEGVAANYRLATTTVGGQTGVGIFRREGGIFLPDDLIGLVQGFGVSTSTLDLNDSTQFDYV